MTLAYSVNRHKYIVIAVLILGLFLTSPALSASKSTTVNVSVTVAPLFEISVVGPDNGHLDFGYIDRDPNGPITLESGEVKVQAKSNLGVPYQITHALVNPLTNGDGISFSDKDLSVAARGINTSGLASSGETVSTDTSTLFRSNPKGKSDTIIAQYKLTVRPSQAAGNYKSKLLYTIVTL